MTESPFDWQFPYPSQRMPVLARNVVATSQPLAAQAGLRMMLKGGNAVDAILASAMALTVVEPTSNGIGSDAFAILWDGSRLRGLNASGRSPAAWNPQRFAGRNEMPRRGWDSVTVPGAVSAWRALSEKFGKLGFADLFEPAIEYASDGFMVSPTTARLWARQINDLKSQPGFAEAFMPDARAPQPGAQCAHPEQPKTLKLDPAARGDSSWHGDLAHTLVAFAQANGGVLSLDDLASHQCDWVDPIDMRYREYQLHEIGPNGQGIGALMALGMLENLDLARLPLDSADTLHAQIEATKLAYADMYEYVADSAAMRTKVSDLIDRGYLAERARLIDMRRAQNPGHGSPPRSGTVYLTAADANGMMVSYIQSNYQGFGSGVVVPGTGISLQDRVHGFTLAPGHDNQVGPRKRPFHTIIAGFVGKEGLPAMSFGVMGGPMQAQGHTQIMIRFADYRQNPQAACDAPRWRIDAGLKVNFEPGFRPEVYEELKRRGHDIAIADRMSTDFGRAQLIYKMQDGYLAASERRADGQAVGF